MKNLTKRLITHSLKDRMIIRDNSGSVSKGLLLGLAVLTLGATITFLLLKPPAQQVNQEESSVATQESLSSDPTSDLVSVPPTPDYSVVPETMLEIEYSLSHRLGDNKPTTSQQVRYVQAGTFYGYRESSPNYILGQHELVLRSKEDQWIVNLFTKSARHMTFAGPTMSRALPVPTTGLKGLLNFGEEIQFFIKNNATQKTVGGEEVYTLSSKKSSLTLYVSSTTKKPVRLEFAGDGLLTEINITKYDVSKKFDKAVFSIPTDIRVLEIAGNQAPVQFRKWLDEDPKILGFYKAPEPSSVLEVLRKIKWVQSMNSRSYLGSFLGIILAKHPEIIGESVEIVKNSEPEVQLIVANALRACRSTPCLNELRTNPFSFSEDGMKQFIEVMEKGAPSGNGIAGPDRWIAEFLVSGDSQYIESLIKFFDQQLTQMADQLIFVEHVKEYARLLKRLSRDNQSLAQMLVEKSQASKTAKLAIDSDDRFGDAFGIAPSSVPDEVKEQGR